MVFSYLVGVDEVGRGPIAGSLCVGACALRREHAGVFFEKVRGLKDSKQLRAKGREEWTGLLHILEEAGFVRLAVASVSERAIDKDGLAKALHTAVGKALALLRIPPTRSFILLDGSLRAPSEYLFQESVINGDETDTLIASASIVAKVYRDRYMTRLAKRYPLYGFEKHKGYGTKEHYRALKKYGVSEVHRKSFLKKFLIV